MAGRTYVPLSPRPSEDGSGLEPWDLGEAPGSELGFLNCQNINARGRQPALDLCQIEMIMQQ